jgi:hypothetical protein
MDHGCGGINSREAFQETIDLTQDLVGMFQFAL